METTHAATRFDVSPSDADWYYFAVIEGVDGETDYVDGYAAGDKPSRTALQEHSKCRHEWVAGLMIVSDDDVEAVAAVRPVECIDCGATYAKRNANPLRILDWSVRSTKR